MVDMKLVQGEMERLEIKEYMSFSPSMRNLEKLFRKYEVEELTLLFYDNETYGENQSRNLSWCDPFFEHQWGQTQLDVDRMAWNIVRLYVEDNYPHILFAKDAELYELNGLLTFVVGGAYSVDKNYRLLRGLAWWPDEQPSDEIKRKAEEKLEEIDWEVDVVLTHTAPLKYEPTEVFLPMINQSMVDKSTEQWLDSIEEQLYYDRWYCGHYHTAKKIDKIQFMYNNFDEFPSKDEENLQDDLERCDECDVNGDNYYLDEDGELECRCMDCLLIR